MSRSDFPLPGGIRGFAKWAWVAGGVLQRLSGTLAQVQFECIQLSLSVRLADPKICSHSYHLAGWLQTRLSIREWRSDI